MINNFTKKISIAAAITAILFTAKSINAQIALPANFSAQLVSSGWSEVEGFRFDSTGQTYVWEKGGKVWVVDTNGTKLTNPLLNISEEVGNWRDHGLNGFALDPNFRTNGYFYLFYTVDRHYLMNFGTGNYNAATNDYYTATIARVTRYTANAATNFTTLVANSRLVLIGENKKTGIPVLHESHSGGSLIFGRDGSLLISTGDGASYNFTDSGFGGTYWSQALTDTIIRDKENVGAFRSQLVDCLNGKILRINPANGDGLPTNPYYDAANPRAAKSRVWNLGLRNPFRMTIRPGTGSTDITAGDPGVLYIGDVGWDTWEDINVSKGPGVNHGWPLYEGLTARSSYQNVVGQYNKDAPNPLYNGGTCNKQFFKFKELLIQATLAPSFPNPCNSGQQVPSTIPHWVHTRPAVDYAHVGPNCRTGIYIGNDAAEIHLDSAGSPCPGPGFGGNAAVGGAWYVGTKYPSAYQDTYFHCDYAQNWSRIFKFNSNNEPISENFFGYELGFIVYLQYNPKDQWLYYVAYPNSIYKITYSVSINNPPTAVASQNTTFGAKPLSVQFTGSNSTDPESLPLTYSWNFGDGTANSTSANPTHIFNPATNNPIAFTVTLTVTDNIGQNSSTTLKVYVNDTPPQVAITSFNNGATFNNSQNTTLPLQASVFDAESTDPFLSYSWQTFLHHNNHEHPEAPDTNHITSTLLTPLPCDSNVYYYRIQLTVTDPIGLATTVSSNTYPACGLPVAQFTANTTVGCPGMTVQFTDQTTNSPNAWVWSFPGGTPSSSNLQNPLVTYNTAGTYNVTLTASSPSGSNNLTKTSYILVNTKPASTITPSGNDTVCQGTSVLLAANTGTSLAYQWIKNNVDVAGATASTYLATAAGSYKVRVTKTTTGCFQTSGVVTKIVYKNASASTTANGSTTFCNGDSVQLMANYGTWYTYQWKKNNANIAGATGVSYMAKTAGNYKVTVTGTGGCTKTSSPAIKVTVNCKLENGADAEAEIAKSMLYPNPSFDKATLHIPVLSESVLNIKIVNVLGKEIFAVAENYAAKAGTVDFAISTSNLSPGIYFIQITGNGESETLKMIVSR